MRRRVGLIWARVSEDKGQTVGGQVAELRALAVRMGLEVPEEFVVTATDSAFRGDPPEKARVLELARRRKFDVLLVWSLDRWSRRRADGAREVFETLPSYGVKVVSIQEEFLSTETLPEGLRDPIGRIFLWLAEEESARRSARVKLRYKTNANRAEGGGGKAKWGRGVVASKEDRARVADLAAQGMSARAIARETGIPRSTVQRLVMAQTSPLEGG